MTGMAVLVTWDGPAPTAVVSQARIGLESRAGGQPISVAAGALGTALLAPAPPGSRAGRDTRPVELDDLIAVGDVRLDNRILLRETLDAPNASDLTLMALAYRRWGRTMGEHLIGDFAAVLMDGGARRVIAIRDHLGIRHAAYSHQPTAGVTLMVATDPGHIAQVMSGPVLLDPEACALRLTGQHGHHHKTVLAGINRIRPASVTVFSPSSTDVHRYWKLDLHRVVPRPFEEHAERVRALMDLAVADRVPPEGSFGCDLSGGLDSTAVTALAAQAAGAERVVAVSAVYPDAPCDERPYISAVLAQVGCRHLWVEPEIPQPDELLAITAATGLALAVSFNPGPTHSVQGLARLGASVVLTGEGGDDWFDVDLRVSADLLARGRPLTAWRLVHQRRTGSFARALVSCSLLPLVPAFMKRAVKRWEKRTAAEPWIGSVLHALVPAGPDEPVLEGPWRTRRRGRIGFLDGTDPWSDDQMWAISAEMALIGVEQRHPFLDVRLVEEALSIPDELHRLHGWRGLQKAAQAGLLPPLVRGRTDKAEFSVVASQRLADLAHRFDGGPLTDAGWIKPVELRKLMAVIQRWASGDTSVPPVTWTVSAIQSLDALIRSGRAALPPDYEPPEL